MFLRTDVRNQECSTIQTHHTKLLVFGVGLVLMTVVAACLPDPQRVQSADLLARLAGARGMFIEQPPRAQDACDSVGYVQQRLSYEPGLAGVQPAWTALSDAAKALQAVCGEYTLLGQPSNDSLALREARQRWQHAIQREIGVACDRLRIAALALDASTPC
jgi:hypothetical protein